MEMKTLLEAGQILIDEDEFEKQAEWCEFKSGKCPKCESWGMEYRDNFCRYCGVKVAWIGR